MHPNSTIFPRPIPIDDLVLEIEFWMDETEPLFVVKGLYVSRIPSPLLRLGECQRKRTSWAKILRKGRIRSMEWEQTMNTRAFVS